MPNGTNTALPPLLHTACGTTLGTSLVHTATDHPEVSWSIIPLRDPLHFCQVRLGLGGELKGRWSPTGQ